MKRGFNRGVIGFTPSKPVQGNNFSNAYDEYRSVKEKQREQVRENTKESFRENTKEWSRRPSQPIIQQFQKPEPIETQPQEQPPSVDVSILKHKKEVAHVISKNSKKKKSPKPELPADKLKKKLYNKLKKEVKQGKRDKIKAPKEKHFKVSQEENNNKKKKIAKATAISLLPLIRELSKNLSEKK